MKASLSEHDKGGAQPKHHFREVLLQREDSDKSMKTTCLTFMFVSQKAHGKGRLLRDASCLSCNAHHLV